MSVEKAIHAGPSITITPYAMSSTSSLHRYQGEKDRPLLFWAIGNALFLAVIDYNLAWLFNAFGNSLDVEYDYGKWDLIVRNQGVWVFKGVAIWLYLGAMLALLAALALLCQRGLRLFHCSYLHTAAPLFLLIPLLTAFTFTIPFGSIDLLATEINSIVQLNEPDPISRKEREQLDYQDISTILLWNVMFGCTLHVAWLGFVVQMRACKNQLLRAAASGQGDVKGSLALA